MKTRIHRASVRRHRWLGSPPTAGVFAAGIGAAMAGDRRSSGEPLDDPTRRFFESRFQRDFAHVRIHADREASAAADLLRARAFTIGNEIYFAAERFRPGSGEGRRLLAHELTHVAQQTRGGHAGRPGHAETPAGEREAASVSDAIAGNTRVPALRQTAPAGIARDKVPGAAGADLLDDASPLLLSMLGSTTVDGFALGSAAIPSGKEAGLRDTAQTIVKGLARFPLSKAKVTGHTDRVGEEARNLVLGTERAAAVSKVLQDAGVTAAAIETDSKGEAEPAVPTKDEKPEPRNRRVQVFFSVSAIKLTLGAELAIDPKVPAAEAPAAPKLDLRLPPDYLRRKDTGPDIDEILRRGAEADRIRKERAEGRKLPSVGGLLGEGAVKLLDPIIKKLPEKIQGPLRDGIKAGIKKGSLSAVEALIDANVAEPEAREALKKAAEAAYEQEWKGKATR